MCYVFGQSGSALSKRCKVVYIRPFCTGKWSANFKQEIKDPFGKKCTLWEQQYKIGIKIVNLYNQNPPNKTGPLSDAHDTFKNLYKIPALNRKVVTGA